jgi:hypothetical protein
MIYIVATAPRWRLIEQNFTILCAPEVQRVSSAVPLLQRCTSNALIYIPFFLTVKNFYPIAGQYISN